VDEKPWSQACENNKGPIAGHLRNIFAATHSVLEIGSGTGQHAVFLARAMPWLAWQTSDLPANHPGIRAWIADEGPANVLPPFALDVDRSPWPCSQCYDGIFTANTLHIMAWPSVANLFAGIGRWLLAGGQLGIYGPFNYGGNYTSDSNAQFDRWLQRQSASQGIRNVEDVMELAQRQRLELVADHAMPANNRLLHWRKVN
jgi:cyclopropane fatty-acyl-phospholipid synthase-like methyltransferase